MGANHEHGLGQICISRRTRNILIAMVAPLVIAAVAGYLFLRPTGATPGLGDRFSATTELVRGTVTDIEGEPCEGESEFGSEAAQCEVLTIRLTSGPEKGETVLLDWVDGPGSAEIDTGDKLVLGHETDLPAGAPDSAAYYFADFERDTPMLILGALFAIAVVALGRFHGLRALIALGLSLIVMTTFILPAIIEGRSPVAVALAGAALIMLLALYLSHGVNPITTTAVLGTLVSLAITAALAAVFVGATSLTGLASEEATYLQAFASQVNIQGLLLGGIIIGSLGVLDDVTVTQASAVWELHQANPAAGFASLYRSALKIGRDHIASTVNTLVLAYAGASLPLLIVFTQSNRSLGSVLTGEVMAVEIVRTLVGSIGLVASVPITTALTALVVTIDREGGRPAPGAPSGDRSPRPDDPSPALAASASPDPA